MKADLLAADVVIQMIIGQNPNYVKGVESNNP
jgi:hypothetical protein